MSHEDPALVSACDELPLWSAPFGLVLLDTVRLRPDLRVLDLSCGTGFPALELAGRIGPGGRVAGVDPWRSALARARTKAAQNRLPNAGFAAGVAERLPFPDASFDAVVSNNGLNNVADQALALAECRPVLRRGGSSSRP
jgi:ubiquinone/menaquinone biosynthesis C-methylase UbiE